jgi:hypothetical protein
MMLLIVLAVVSLIAALGALVVADRDGYRRVPTRSSGARP